MNSKDYSTPFEFMETERELYKKTPLKKRPIQQNSLPADEKKISKRPTAIKKPSQRILDAYAESVKDLEAIFAPITKAPAEDKVSPPVQANSETAMAIPVLKTTSGEKKVPSRTPKISKPLSEKNLTKQEWEDFNLAIELQKEEFNLRERRPKRTISDLQINLQQERQPVKTKRTRAERKKRSPSKMPQKMGRKQGKPRRKRTPKRTSRRTRTRARVATAYLLSGDSTQTFVVSPEMAKILGQNELPSYAINDAIQYLFLERNLFENDRKYVICDDELANNIFAGKRRLRFVDAKKRLYKHFTMSD